jgi:methyl-accepting chemotaxis protein
LLYRRQSGREPKGVPSLDNSPTSSTLTFVALPLVGAVLLPLVVDLEPAFQTSLFLVGAIAAVGVAAYRLRGSGSSLGAAQLLSLAQAGRWQELLDLARKNDQLSPQLERAVAQLEKDRGQNAASLEAHRKALEAVGMELTVLNETLAQQLDALDEASSASDSTMSTQKGIGDRLDNLSHAAEESSTSIMQMVTINNEVRTNVHNLASSVEETTTAIEEMTFSSKEVAKNIEELSTAAEETAASMNEMDVSISQVETNANETSKLSELVTRDAETGVGAINHTIKGIDKIKESSRVASEVISSLGQKISQIGNILNVIDDVAEQTNLLALNAAIIAAQAGEHGRGFAVVADEIKALAERTGASTKEIAGLINTIQNESKNAVNVMSRGVEDVEEGVRLGHNAEDALRKIVESAKRSTLMIQAIAQATVEQAKGSKQVTNAIARIAETVQQIAYATAEQAKGAEHIMQSAERMKMITQQVERSTDEQSRGGQQVTRAIETIRDLAEQISQAQRGQLRSGERLTSASERARGSGKKSQELSQQLIRTVGELGTTVTKLAPRGD